MNEHIHGWGDDPTLQDHLEAENARLSADNVRLRRLEAALADDGLVHYATDYALINTLDAFDVYRDQLRTAADKEPEE